MSANIDNNIPMENDQFDYARAMAELEQIARVVEDPSTSLDDIAKHMERSKQLVSATRAYLRTVRTSIENATAE